MCILIACKGGAIPPKEHLYESIDNNPDGSGWAIHTGDAIMRMRTVDKGYGAVESFMAAREQYPDGPALFHARIASVGRVSLANTHPFTVDNRPDLVVAHNGCALSLGSLMPRGFDAEHSDTRVFAEQYLPRVGIASLDSMRDDWEKWADGNKLGFLSTAPELSQQLYIIGESDGHWIGDVWYSNHSYLSWNDDYWNFGRSLIRRLPPTPSDTWEAVETICGSCGTLFNTASYQMGCCSECYACIDCSDIPCTCVYGPGEFCSYCGREIIDGECDGYCLRYEEGRDSPDPFREHDAYEAALKTALRGTEDEDTRRLFLPPALPAAKWSPGDHFQTTEIDCTCGVDHLTPTRIASGGVVEYA